MKTSGCYFIAEIGVNHNGRLDLARQLIDIAADSGADAVKFQTFSAENLVLRQARKARYQAQNDQRADESQFDMLKRLELSADDLRACKAHCVARGITFMSTPFDESAADLLESIGIEAFKISSGDLTHLPMLTHIGRKGLPVIISTGMANLAETEAAVRTLEAAQAGGISILHCVSNYPAAPEDCNLRAMETLRRAFGYRVGWSDHTLGNAISLAAVAMGAEIIEKHFTLDRDLPGPDHKASLTPTELNTLISGIRDVEKALGDGIKRPTRAEAETATVARRSLVSARAIKAGETIDAGMIACKRPGEGLAPRYYHDFIGKTARRDIEDNVLLNWGDISL